MTRCWTATSAAETAEVRAVFAGLREQLVPLVKAITANASRVSDAPVNGHFPKAAQEAFARQTRRANWLRLWARAVVIHQSPILHHLWPR